MSALAAALRLRAEGRARVPLDEIWLAYHSAEPVQSAASRKRDSLRAALDALEQCGEVRMPRSPKLWDRSAEPALPHWVRLTPSVGHERATPPTLAWAPELEFARSISHPTQRATLAAVQRFLAAGGRGRPMVPMRERSVEVFGDEKKLDRLVHGALFQPGRLTLGLLRCFAVSPPLVWHEYDAASTTALIVENHHTFHSFKRWNEDRLAYRVVAYGAGKAVAKAIGSFTDAAGRLGIDRIEYFGDLDPEGIAIGAKLAEVTQRGSLPPVVPAERWYTLLLDRPAAIADTQDPGGPVSADSMLWFSPGLRARIALLTESGRRLPQELVGWEVLSGLPVE